ncbi:MAG TPA: hypothetical protein DHW39_07555 [Erysipelotrichaceae bacterium]|nr:hypothetical protein [Erysipelotrichaceae bacterium]
MKTIHVTAAVIRDRDRIFATQRGYGEYKDGWEFPGGKIEENETSEEALIREIREELNMQIRVLKYLGTAECDYPGFHLSMDCWLCEITEGRPELLEHEAARWLKKDELDSVAWLPADQMMIPIIRKELEKMKLQEFKWTREPKDFRETDGRIEIITAPHTDLWQRTYYHFRNDNAPVYQTETDEKYFSFIVKTDFTESHHRFDQCGIVMYLDSDNWLKASVEYENEQFQHLGSVVTNHGYSDWATTAIPADIKQMWYRFSRREDDYCVECSYDGITFSQMRVCHMHEGKGTIRFGIYACSPEDSSFKAVFTDLEMTECAWKAHDGQKPDEE